jgi:hypothetical protein
MRLPCINNKCFTAHRDPEHAYLKFYLSSVAGPDTINNTSPDEYQELYPGPGIKLKK